MFRLVELRAAVLPTVLSAVTSAIVGILEAEHWV
jgi:hypothetical protein